MKNVLSQRERLSSHINERKLLLLNRRGFGMSFRKVSSPLSFHADILSHHKLLIMFTLKQPKHISNDWKSMAFAYVELLLSRQQIKQNRLLINETFSAINSFISRFRKRKTSHKMKVLCLKHLKSFFRKEWSRKKRKKIERGSFFWCFLELFRLGWFAKCWK